MNYYYNPVHTIQARGSLSEIPGIVKEMAPEGGRILVLGWSEDAGSMKAVQELRKDPAYMVRNVTFTVSNPTINQLFQVYGETKKLLPEIVIAVGGGSVMDVGKALCLLYGEDIGSVDELRSLICEGFQQGPRARWIGVPTTAGTGSEVTCWATIWDPEQGVKRSVESRENYAYASVADPDLTESMPVSLAVSSALDAVAHAVESYWARGTNLVSRALALEAVRLIMGHIDGLPEGEPEARDYMSQGSMLAGLAFSGTKTTACHSLSYPLTMEYAIPHGTAVSLLLAPVLMVNQEKTEAIELLLAALGEKDGEGVRRRITSLLRRAGIPPSLEEWKVPREDLPRLASLGVTKGRADNNPVDLTPEDIEKLLECIYTA